MLWEHNIEHEVHDMTWSTMPWNKLSDVAIHSQADTVKKQEQFYEGLKAGLAALVILTATYFRYVICSMSLHLTTCEKTG